MIGAIIGDIVGSAYEFWPIRRKNFELFNLGSLFTDDSVMTIAVGCALMRHRQDGEDFSAALIEEMQKLGRRYPDAGYGASFRAWIFKQSPLPYNSYGNGSAMRVSACGYAARSLEEALQLAAASAEVTHNHPEGVKGAQATAAAIYLARSGASKEDIRRHIDAQFYPLRQTLDEIRPTYHFNETCQETVPQAIIAFLESENFEDSLRNAVSLGGDADTLAAITGSIAWAFYGRDGVTDDMRQLEDTVRREFLPEEFKRVLDAFEAMCRE